MATSFVHYSTQNLQPSHFNYEKGKFSENEPWKIAKKK